MPRPDTRWAVLGWKMLPPSNLTSVEETRIHCFTWAGSIGVRCDERWGEERDRWGRRTSQPAPRRVILTPFS